MEIFAIITGVSILAVLLYGIKLIHFDISESEKTIKSLLDENIQLLEENHKLKHKKKYGIK
jgi:hypothetical protein